MALTKIIEEKRSLITYKFYLFREKIYLNAFTISQFIQTLIGP